MLNKLFLLGFTSIFCVNMSWTQLDGDVNQYMVHQPFVNFASASSYEDISAALYYRNQWVGFNGAPVNYAAQFSIPVKGINSSFGVRFIKDEIGAKSSEEVSLNYAYRFRLNRKSYLSFSLSPKLGFVRHNRRDLIAAQEKDPLLMVNIQKNGLVNAEMGGYYFRDKFYFGAVVPNLIENNFVGASNVDTYFDFKGLEWFVHSGYEWDLRRKDNFNMSGLIKSGRGAALHGEFNVMYQLNNKLFGVGASYRTSKAMVAMLRFSLLKQLSLSYSFQYNFSDLAIYQDGTHEIMLVFERKVTKELVRINVPRF